MITVTQVQQEAVAAELHKRRQAQAPSQLASVPQPEPEHIAWAKRVMSDGYRASVTDRVDAMRILDAACLSADDFHAGREPDTAPSGARDVAAAHLERAQAEADQAARKAANVRGFEEGPAEGLMPGRPEPASYERPYVLDGHAAQSPQAEGPRANPMPMMQHVVLPGQPRAAAIPPQVIANFTMGSPSER